MRLLLEAGIETQYRSRALQAVASEIQLLHRMHVLAMHLHRGAVGRFGQPDVQVFALARFEEHDVVAVVEVGEFIELGELGLGVEFGILAAVWEERVEVGEEVAVSE